MRFGIVFPTWIYKRERIELADACFRTLLHTKGNGGSKPLFVMLVKDAPYAYPVWELREVFDVVSLPQRANGAEFKGVSQPLIYGTDLVFKHGADFAIHLNDDSLFHPEWLLQLEGLIKRRPRAVVWSIYHSAHTKIHKELRFDGPDVLVQSINGDGFTIAKQEWLAWGQRWQDHAWPRDPRTVVTLDYKHFLERTGERWVTKMSYMEHTGRDGIHCKPGIPEYALNFAGTGEAASA
jgi:hypothetical protein